MSSPTEKPAAESPEWGYDLLLYGHEQLLRGSDSGVLVAFAAIAFQEVRDERQPHHHVGFGFLLFSVLMCAVVHFAMGNAYIGRAKRLILGRKETTPQAAARRAYTTGPASPESFSCSASSSACCWSCCRSRPQSCGTT